VKKSILAIAIGLTLAGAAAAGGGHVKAPLEPVGGSGVSGFVQLTALPHGSTNIHVHATGLTPGVSYSSFEYEASDCTGEFDLLGTFTANPAGIGKTHVKLDESLDEIGSVSVRTPDYFTMLFACAVVD
jgi:hypothetical protein